MLSISILDVSLKIANFRLQPCLPGANELMFYSQEKLHKYGLWFIKKMSSYQYRKSHCGDKTILRPSYLHNGISYTGKTTSLFWIGALDVYFGDNGKHLASAADMHHWAESSLV